MTKSSAVSDYDRAASLDSLLERRRRTDELFKSWDEFYSASTPVAQGAALLDFSNNFYHYRNQIELEEKLAETDGYNPQAHALKPGDRVRYTRAATNSTPALEMIGEVVEAAPACFISVADETGAVEAVDLKDIVDVL